jgi:hypothetical protein
LQDFAHPDFGLRFFLASQLFFEVFTSKVEMRRTTLVLLQFGQRIGFIFFWYCPKENMRSKFRSHFWQ